MPFWYNIPLDTPIERAVVGDSHRSLAVVAGDFFMIPAFYRGAYEAHA